MLTQDQREVIILAARNLSYEEIAEMLGMSITKVKNVLHQASIKLGTCCRDSTAISAIVDGYIRLDEVFSPEEVTDFLVALGQDELSKIVQFLCQRTQRPIVPIIDETVLPIDRGQNTTLSEGERNVLILVGRGLTTKEIADTLCISVGTVRNTVMRACSKLGTPSRARALESALKKRVILLSELYSFDETLQLLASLSDEYIDKIAQLLTNKLDEELHKNNRTTKPWLVSDIPSHTLPNLCFGQAS